MEINGKIYRNLEGQVGYLTEKWDDLQDQINDVRAHLTHYVIVDALPVDPEDIDTSAVYLVGPLGTAPDTYYEEWVYVQKADESWMWEKLGDTASVDLSGYLEKDTTASTYPKVYVKWGDGTQGTENLTQDNTYNAVVRRKADGRITVPAPSADGDCANKKYVDDNFLAKQTGAYTYMQVYGKYANGNQAMLNVADTATGNTIAYRDSAGKVLTKDPVNAADAVNKSYADTNYLAKQTGTSTLPRAYVKNTDGTQASRDITTSATPSTLVYRDSYGRTRVASPSDGEDAANKAYVDAAVGQLLYLHDIELVITVDASNKLYVKAYLVSSSATAITTFDRQLYRRIDVQWGAFGPDMANVEAVSVTKLPDTFRQDEFDEPFVGFLYQYISGGNLISGKTDSNMSTTITDTVISF